jgi:hypothetical protein
MQRIFVISFLLIALNLDAQEASKNRHEMMPLFNGRDFDGWHTFLKTKGANNDPEQVFGIEKGLLHISGKEFGYIITDKAYKNFHLALEFKWGKKKWPPRDADTTRRDNGILYYVPVDAKDTVWPKSIECQIQEGDVGDIWLVDSATVVVDGKRSEAKDFEKIQKKADGERKRGKWNRVEVIANNGKISYLVNGKTVNEAEDPSLSEGKIIIQSEGAEIFYRKIEIAEL